jgi:hypothetical protein
MDRFAFHIEEGAIVVDTDAVTEGAPPGPETIDEPPSGPECLDTTGES